MPIPNDRVIIYKRDLDHYKAVEKQFEELDIKMDCLEACGVDNWCGYGEAMSEAYKIIEGEDNE